MVLTSALVMAVLARALAIAKRLLLSTPVTPAALKALRPGASLRAALLSAKASIADKALKRLTVSSMSDCRAVRLLTSAPLSALAAMAASTAARLPSVTPLTPRLFSAVAVKAGLAALPAAVVMMPVTVLARASISGTLSTAVITCAPKLSFSKASAFAPCAVLCAARPMLAPMAAYCAAVGSATVRSLAEPLASAKMRL